MTGRTHALDLVPGLRELAQAQLGVVRRDQLRALGVTHHHVRRQVEAERWRALGPHAVVLQTGALNRMQWLSLGAAHAGPGSELDLWAALEHAGLRGWERRPVHVAVPRGRRVARLEGVVVRQTSRLPRADQRVWPPAAPPARAAVEASCRERTDRGAVGLLLAVAQQGVASPRAMLVELDQLWRPKRAPMLHAALAEAAAGSESVAEIDVVPLIRRAGLPEPRRQVLVSTPVGDVRLDLVVDLPDGRRLNIEVDGPHHLDPEQRAKDAVRDAALMALGYLVVRLTALEVRADRANVVRRLRLIGLGAALGESEIRRGAHAGYPGSADPRR